MSTAIPQKPDFERAMGSRSGRWAIRLLQQVPLAAVLNGLILVQLALWIPHYLGWPYWADHDVFATAARAWFDGRLPYRDTLCNNFPGTIYLFVGLGRLLGWGRPEVFRAFDAGLLIVFLGLLSGWSKRVFETRVAGAIGGLIFLGTYLSLDYAHAGQRDWHASMLAASALLILQANRSRWRAFVAALLFSAAFNIRPQVVLLAPGVVMGLFVDRSSPAIRHLFVFSVVFAIATLLLFAPLFVFGIFDDFLRSLKLVAYGGSYNRVGPASFLKGWLIQGAQWRWWVVPASIVLLAGRSASITIAIPWLTMLAGVSFYKPISPIAHSYLDIPIALVWSINVAVLAGVSARRIDLPSELRLAVTLLCLGLGATTLHPLFCAVGPSLGACRAYLTGKLFHDQPPGYRRGSVATSAYYPWNDYSNLLDHLRRTNPNTPLANMLKGDPAITAMVDRPSVFPAESVAWLRMVRRQNEPKFAEALEQSRNGLVIWIPDEVGPDPKFRYDLLEKVVRREFQFERRFGAIEVWGRKP